MLRLILLLFMLFFSGCGPELSITPVSNNKYLKIGILPDSVERTVILSNVFPMDTFVVPVGTEVLTTGLLPFGTYEITVKAPGFGTMQKEVYLNSNSNNGERITLNPFPAQLTKYQPAESDTIAVTSSFTFWFTTIFDKATVKKLIRFTPKIEFRVDTIFQDYPGQEVKITAHPADLFKYDSITLTISDTVPSLLGERLEFPFIRTYKINHSKQKKILFDYYLSDFSPKYSDYYISDYYYNHITTADEIRFTFRSAVVESTLTRGFRINPAVNGILDFSNNYSMSYRFIPGDKLKSGQTYRITLDSTIRFMDSTNLRGDLSWEFTTLPLTFDFYRSYPRYGTTMAVRDKPFLLMFNSPVDSSSMVKGFSILPPLDSLVFKITKSRDSLFISHALLDTAVQYTITLDSTITDRYGAPLTKTHIDFKAE